MNELVLDFHLHSRFSRAVSQRMNLTNMYIWGRKKGISILSVSDFTHPIWFREAMTLLDEVSDGIYSLKDSKNIEREYLSSLEKFPFLGPYFMLSTEVSSIYTEGGRGHRIHNLIFAPNFETAVKINKEFSRRGFNLLSDGRPILGLTSKNLCELLFSIDQHIALIPCHIWTPWFSLYGSRSGYDAIVECFAEFSKYIFAVETGLSSDPSMNWRISELESRSIVSFSDAHSLEKMGREATVLRKKNGNSKISNAEITYNNVLNSFVRGKERIFEIAYTIEFYPEEGKYHYTGHRLCGVSYSPSNTPKDAICPVCQKPLTVGVMHRVDDLAKLSGGEDNFVFEKDEFEVAWVNDKTKKRPPFVSLVPLLEVLSEVHEAGVGTNSVLSSYELLISSFGSEHEVLFRVPIDKISTVAGFKIGHAIKKVRSRNIEIEPGFDGEYGKVSIGLSDEKEQPKQQLGLF